MLKANASLLIASLHMRYHSLSLHIVHFFLAPAIQLICAVKASGLPLTI